MSQPNETFVSKLLRKGQEYGTSVARGVPQLATGFVDLAAAPFTMTGLLDEKDVFGGTEYLTERGLLPKKQQGLDNETAELVSSALSPAGAAKAALLGLGTLGAAGGKQLLKQLKGVDAAPVGQSSRSVAAPKEVKVDKKFKTGEKAGNFRGTEAFGGINQKQLNKMRAEYLRKMETGVDGRMWYDDTSKDIFRLVGSDAGQADKLANALAVTSSATGVNPNLGHAVKAWNQNAVGDPVRSGRFPTNMGKQIKKAFDDPEASASGLKRSPFSAGLSVDWRGPDFANRATHDIHDVRAWGITDPATGEPWNKGVGEAGHRFLDEQSEFVTNKANKTGLGGVEDWRPYRSQAAAWITQKAQKEGKPISETAKHYGDYINDQSAQITREWVPGDNTGHLPELLRASEGLRGQFSDSLEEVVTGPKGIDLLANKMGALSDVVQPNRGVYEGATNKGYASIIPSGKTNTGSAYMTDPSSARLLDSVAAGHGLLGIQKQSAWNQLTQESPIKSGGAYQINRGSPFSEQELADLNQITDRVGGDIPQVDPQGARILEFADEGSASRTAMMNELRKAYPDADIATKTRDGNLFPVDENFNAPEKWSTQPYIDKIEAGGPNVVAGFDEAAREMSPQLLAKTEEFAAANNLTQAEWYRPMMEALSTGGIEKLKELVKQGIVPVVALGIIGSLEGEQEPETAVY